MRTPVNAPLVHLSPLYHFVWRVSSPCMAEFLGQASMV